MKPVVKEFKDDTELMKEVKNLSDNWTVVTADGSDAAHFEYSLHVTPDGVEILTPWE